MDLSQPKTVEERMREAYTDNRNDSLSHTEAIVEALHDAVQIGYDDEHLARAARELAAIDEDDEMPRLIADHPYLPDYAALEDNQCMHRTDATATCNEPEDRHANSLR